MLAVPPEKWPALKELCDSEGVEATDLGEFVDSGRLTLRYHGEVVADLSMNFLHEGRPAVVREATWTPPEERPMQLARTARFHGRPGRLALALGRMQQGMDHPPVRPRGSGPDGDQAARGRQRRRAGRRGGDRAGARVDPRPGRRLRNQSALRQARPLSRWRAA